MGKPVRCLNCGSPSGKHSFPNFHCPDPNNKGKFLAAETFQSDIGIPVRKRLLAALGWSGGTVEQVVAEVGRLKAHQQGVEALRQAFVRGAKWWEFDQTGGTMWQSDQGRVYDASRHKYPDEPLGQGVAALLPEHGEVKHGG